MPAKTSYHLWAELGLTRKAFADSANLPSAQAGSDDGFVFQASHDEAAVNVGGSEPVLNSFGGVGPHFCFAQGLALR